MNLQIFGGRGSKGKDEFRFNYKEGLKGESIEHLPVEANSKIKTKTVEALVTQFRNEHIINKKNATHEFAYAHDSNGSVLGYYEGKRSSVGIPERMLGQKGVHIIHSHPSGGNFSGQDLRVFADSKIQSLIASGAKYDYVISKDTHFKRKEFTKAIGGAILKGKDYNTAVHEFLLKCQADNMGIVYKRIRRS